MVPEEIKVNMTGIFCCVNKRQDTWSEQFLSIRRKVAEAEAERVEDDI
jgi:hypothetical protein